MNNSNNNKKITFFHYLIIRFSINLNETDTFKRERDPLNPVYLERRFALFTKYCLPSLKNQTNKNFILILVIDPNLSSEYREKLKKLTKNCGFNTQLVEYGGNFELDNLLNCNEIDMMKKTQSITGKKYICTTRLDDDDSLNPNYFNYAQYEIQTIIDKKLFFRPFIHTLVYGNYLMIKDSKCYLKKVRKPRLACGLSFVNTLDDNTTIYSRSHHRWNPSEYPQYLNLHENMYFVLVHVDNDSQRYEQEEDNLTTFTSVACCKSVSWYFNYVDSLLGTYSNPGLRQLRTKFHLKNKSKSTPIFPKLNLTSKMNTKSYTNYSDSSDDSNNSNSSNRSNGSSFRYDITKLKGMQKINPKRK